MLKTFSRLGIAALLLSGCASTVQQRRLPLDSSGQAASATSDGASAEAAADDVGYATPGDATTAAAAKGGGPSTHTTARGASVAGAAGPTGKLTGRGFTATELFIGYLTWKDVSRAGTAAGIAGADYGDQELTANAIVKDINDRGGIAGRKVVPVFYDYETADILGNPAVGDQKACSRLTEDRPVFAVIAVTGPLTEVLPTCLYKVHVPILINDNIPRPQQAFTQWAPYFYSTASPTTEHFVHAIVPRASAIGYFKGWDTTNGAAGTAPTKVGVLSTDSEPGRIFNDLIAGELKKIGLTIASHFDLSGPFDESGLQSAVIRFRRDGVTHVIPEGLNLLLFPQAAESQHYRPRYLVSTVQALTLVQTTASAAQLAGSMGVGYFPTYDVDDAYDLGDVSPSETRCKSVQQRAGNDTTRRNAYNLMVKACDGFAFLTTTIGKHGLSTDGIWRAVRENTAIEPAGTFAISYADGRLDGPAAVRDLAFDSNAKAFVYLSKTAHPM